MPHSTEEILSTILEKLRHLASTETVVGQPVTVGNLVILPVIKITVGFAAAGAEGTGGKDTPNKSNATGTGGGGGGGANVTPVGFIVYDGGDIKFLSAAGKGGLENLIEAVPEMIEKIRNISGKKEKKTASEPPKAE